MTRSLEERLVGGVTFPLSNWLFNRRRIMPTYRGLLDSERASPEHLRRLQLERLRRVLTAADRWIPFYRERFAAAGLVPGEVESLDDLAVLPTLERSQVNANLPKLVDRRQRAALEAALRSTRRAEPIPLARFRRSRLVRNSTSGSTGTPAVFVEDGSTSAISWANELRFKHRFGIEPGAREARLHWIATETAPPILVQELRRRLWNQLALPGLNLVASDHDRNLRRLRAFEPRLIWGSTTTLVRMAEVILERADGPGFRPQLIVSWSEPLLSHQRQLLERVFSCPAGNLYGTREVGHIATTCPQGSLHLNQENFLLETMPSRSGDGPGEMIVTTLFESPMPFIRYRVGDLGELSAGPCPCGRTLPVIQKLSGRAVEPFVTSDGRTFSGAFWTVLFAKDPVSRAIRQFQTVYRRDGSLCFRIVPNELFTEDIETFVRHWIRDNVQRDLVVKFEYPAEISPEPSGKSALLIDERR